jgi:catechol 2,3-dioxygenase-like lactoylglutathione lyase family enzyme
VVYPNGVNNSWSIDVSGVCVLLQVFDMPASVRFYRDVLGFEVVQTSPHQGDQFDWGLLRLGDAEVMLNTAYEQEYRPPQAESRRMAVHGDTCLYFGCPDVDAAYRHLRAHGIDVNEPKVAPYGMKQLYLHDPDGYSLCFQWPVEKNSS